MTHEPHPEHAAARLIMDQLAKAAGLPSGQTLITHLSALDKDSPALKFIGEAISSVLREPPAAREAPAPDKPPLAEVG